MQSDRSRPPWPHLWWWPGHRRAPCSRRLCLPSQPPSAPWFSLHRKDPRSPPGWSAVKRKRDVRKAQCWPASTIHLPADKRAGRGGEGIWYSVCVCVCVVSMSDEWWRDKQEYLCKQVSALCLPVWCDTMQFHYIVFFWERWKLNTELWSEGRHKGEHWPQAYNDFSSLHCLLTFNVLLLSGLASFFTVKYEDAKSGTWYSPLF